MSPTTFAVPLFVLLSAACASTTTPQPLTSLPTPPEFAANPAMATPVAAGDIQFNVAEPKAKTTPEDGTPSTTLQADKASGDVKTKHVHAAQ
jgi:hypothetical protein